LKKLVLACALSATAVLVAPAIASAAGVLASPAPNETVKGYHPTLTWTVPDGEIVSDVVIAQSKHTDHGFLSEAIDDHQVKGKTSYHYTASILTPGDYYWQLSGLDANGDPALSAIQRFVIPPVIDFTPVKAHWNPLWPNGRPVDYFVATIRCNLVSRPTMMLKVYQGKKVIGTDSWSGHWCTDMQPYAFADTWQKPVSMPKGTRLTMQFLVKYGSFTAASALTPFSAH
jgi:hypothetical protein